MARIDKGMLGYEATSGRYAAFFLGHIYETRKDDEKAEYYYTKAIEFSREIAALESGYYHFSLIGMGDIAARRGDKKMAKSYYKEAREESKRKDRANKVAKSKIQRL